VNCGDSQAFAISANGGYQIADVVVDGGSVGAVSGYTFNGVNSNHTIAASFAQVTGSIGPQSSGNYICPTNPCQVIPVVLNRAYADPVLGYHVKLQLSPNLQLCGPITEGPYLNSSGPTLFQVVNNGGGSYTVDDALTSNCGPTGPSGVLFLLHVTSSDPGGAGTINVTQTTMRDCANQPLAVQPTVPAVVPIDNQAPSVTVNIPNGGEVFSVGQAVKIDWSATDNSGVANVDLAYSTDGGATYPNVIATGIANTGSYIWNAPNTPTNMARVQVTAHDVACSSSSDASDNNFTIGTYTITSSAGPGGTIAPNGATIVGYGASQDYTITPNAGYQIADVLVDGSSVGPVSSYTFNNVTADHTIARASR
jgi:hypothetical protein